MKTSQHGFAAVNGAKLYYEVEGEGYPLLLLHAGVADSRMWNAQVGVYAQEYQVIRYDLRGFGQSVMPSGRFSHYDDAAQLLKFLHIEHACVIGVSFGGSVAIDVTIAYPDMVDALVLGAPALSGYEPSSPAMQQFFIEEDEALQQGDLARATEINLRMWVDGPQRSPEHVPPDIRKQVYEMQFQNFSVPEAADVVEVELEPPAMSRLHTIQIPTLVIVGEQDVPEFQQISTIVTEGIPNATMTTIPDTAHLPSMEHPDVFNRIILNFLNERHSYAVR